MIPEKEIKAVILQFLEKRAQRLGIKEKFLLSDFELLRSGLLDSMSFLDLIAALEEHFKIQIDFEDKSPSEFSTLAGLVKMVQASAQPSPKERGQEP